MLFYAVVRSSDLLAHRRCSQPARQKAYRIPPGDQAAGSHHLNISAVHMRIVPPASTRLARPKTVGDRSAIPHPRAPVHPHQRAPQASQTKWARHTWSGLQRPGLSDLVHHPGLTDSPAGELASRGSDDWPDDTSQLFVLRSRSRQPPSLTRPPLDAAGRLINLRKGSDGSGDSITRIRPKPAAGPPANQRPEGRAHHRACRISSARPPVPVPRSGRVLARPGQSPRF